MTIKNTKERISITVPKDRLAFIKKEAVRRNLTISQFLVNSTVTVATMQPTSHLEDFIKDSGK